MFESSDIKDIDSESVAILYVVLLSLRKLVYQGALNLISKFVEMNDSCYMVGYIFTCKMSKNNIFVRKRCQLRNSSLRNYIPLPVALEI